MDNTFSCGRQIFYCIAGQLKLQQFKSTQTHLGETSDSDDDNDAVDPFKEVGAATSSGSKTAGSIVYIKKMEGRA